MFHSTARGIKQQTTTDEALTASMIPRQKNVGSRWTDSKMDSWCTHCLFSTNRVTGTRVASPLHLVHELDEDTLEVHDPTNNIAPQGRLNLPTAAKEMSPDNYLSGLEQTNCVRFATINVA